MGIDPRLVNYGRDLSCAVYTVTLPFFDGTTRTTITFDVGPSFDETSGRAMLAEALVRMIVTPRGTLVDPIDPEQAANYGFDVRAYLNDDVDDAEVSRIAAGIEDQWNADERVVSVTVDVTFASGKLRIEARIQDGAGPFKLVLEVNQFAVKILEAA